MTEEAFNQSFAKQIGDIGLIVTPIMAAVFFTLLLLTGNTMAQAVRERVPELAVLKTIGFSNRSVLVLVLAEALLLCLFGGVVGMSIATLLGAMVSKGTGGHPATVAVKGPWAPDTRMYLPYLSRYLIVEDLCASCMNDWIDVWAGGAGKPKSSVLPCQDALYHRGPRDPSGRVEVEIDPPSWYPVVNAWSLC